MLVWDADCGFCQASLRWARRLGCECPDAPWQSLDLASLGLSENDVTTAAWFVDPAGTLHRGHHAIALTLRSSRFGVVRAAGRLVGSRMLTPVAARAYEWVATHRHRLPGSTATCDIR